MAEHDQRFKQLVPVFAQELLLLTLPAWADRCDCAPAVWLQQDLFVDPPHGETRHVDLVARVRLREAVDPEQAEQEPPWQALLHVEVEAGDSVAELRGRVHDYRSLLRMKYRLPVLSLAVYLGVSLQGRGWDAYEATYWGERVELTRFPYLGLPGLDAFAHVQGDNIRGVALSVLMRFPPERAAELKALALQRVATGGQNEARRALLVECIEAYLPLEGEQQQRFEELLATETYQEAHSMAVTTFEKGMEQGTRRLVQQQLTTRFGPLSEAAREQLGRLTLEQLEQLGQWLLTAGSLAELGLQEPPAASEDGPPSA